jgi:hypothetical protein
MVPESLENSIEADFGAFTNRRDASKHVPRIAETMSARLAIWHFAPFCTRLGRNPADKRPPSSTAMDTGRGSGDRRAGIVGAERLRR